MVQRFNHLVLMRAPGLLPMLYTPRELEEELQVSAITIREWIKQGLPHQRDPRGHLWVNGVEFAGWVKQIQQAAPRIALEADEAYCLKCCQSVKMPHPQISHRGRLKMLHDQCPQCGSAIYRGV